MRAFVSSIPELDYQQYKEFAGTRFIRYKKPLSYTIMKSGIATLSKLKAKAGEKKTPILQEYHFNKLRTTALRLFSLFAEVFKIEITGLPECFTKKQQMYHSNKSQLLKVLPHLLHQL